MNFPPLASERSLDELTAAFFALFSYRLETEVKRVGSPTWRPVSRFHYLSDEEIANSIQTDSKLFRAVSLDTKSRFLILLIPDGSPYKTPDQLTRLRVLLGEQGVHISPYEFEGEWFLFISLAEPVRTDEFSEMLAGWLVNRGYAMHDNTLQVLFSGDTFPLPLQPGFMWLGNNALPFIYRAELPLRAALEHFLDGLHNLQSQPDRFMAALAVKENPQTIEQPTTIDLTGLSAKSSKPVHPFSPLVPLETVAAQAKVSIFEQLSGQELSCPQNLSTLLDCQSSTDSDVCPDAPPYFDTTTYEHVDPPSPDFQDLQQCAEQPSSPHTSQLDEVSTTQDKPEPFAQLFIFPELKSIVDLLPQVPAELRPDGKRQARAGARKAHRLPPDTG